MFHDRLVDDADREWLIKVMREKTELHFKLKYDNLMERLTGKKCVTFPVMPSFDHIVLDNALLPLTPSCAQHELPSLFHHSTSANSYTSILGESRLSC